MKKLSEVFSEQHREKGRFKPTIPHMVLNKATASPRSSSDSANVSLKERCWPGYKPTPGKKAYAKGSCVKEGLNLPKDAPSIQSIAKKHGVSEEEIQKQLEMGLKVEQEHTSDVQAATEIALDHLNEKPDYYTRLKKFVEDIDGTTEQVAGSAQSTLTDKPNREPMKTYKQKNITELSTELLDRYKDKAATDSAKADKEGNTAKADKRFSGVVKATTKQFDNFKKKGFKEETEQIDELKKATLASYIDKAADSVKSKKDAAANMYRFTKQVTSAMKKSAEGDKRIEGIKSATKRLAKEDVEQIDEISAQAHKEYQTKARADVKSLAKHTGGEYGDIAKNIMKRRMKGLSTSTALQARDKMAKMNKEETDMNEAIKDKFDIGEYDQEGDMAKSDLRSIMANAKKLHDMIEDADNLPEWVQSKITKAEDYISTVANYLTAEMSEETEIQEDEKKPDDKFKSLAPKDDHHTYYKFVVGKAKMGKPLSQKEKSFASSYRLMRQEEVEQIDEKNVPTSPEKWAQAKAQAKAKFDVYPSAYANGWAAKKYKAMGGGWKSVSEETNNLPFTPDKPKKQSVVAGKYGKGYSTARHLARSAMQKQVEKMKKQPIKEESRKAAIVKDIMKKKKGTSDDAFQKEPELSSTLTKVQ